MNENRAKQSLRRILRSFTAGSVLHLLADIQRELANRVRRKDKKTFQQLKEVEATLFVVGLGIDAARPR